MNRFMLAALTALFLSVSAFSQTTQPASQPATTLPAIPTDPEAAYTALQGTFSGSTADNITYKIQIMNTFHNIWEADRTNDALLCIARTCMVDGQYDRSESFLKEWEGLTSLPNELAYIQMVRGEILVHKKMLPEALAMFSNGLAKLNTPGGDSHYQAVKAKLGARIQKLMSDVMIRQGNTAGAEQILQTAIANCLENNIEYLPTAMRSLHQFYLTTGNTTASTAMINDVLTNKAAQVQDDISYWQQAKAMNMAKAGDVTGALAYLHSLPLDENKLVIIDKLSTNINLLEDETVRYLATRPPGPLTDFETSVLQKIVPGNDAMNCMLTDAQGVALGYKKWARQNNGLLSNDQMARFVLHLQTGAGDKFLQTTDQARAFAAKIAATDAPLKSYLVPMLTGDYPTAAKVAFGAAKGSDDDSTYAFFVAALAATVRCQDQCYNGRAIDVIKWINGDSNVNPINDLLQQ